MTKTLAELMEEQRQIRLTLFKNLDADDYTLFEKAIILEHTINQSLKH